MSSEGKGRILRLKQGYNPNSSSIGTIVFALPAALMASTVAFGAAAAFICTAFSSPGNQRVPAKPESDDAGADGESSGGSPQD